MKVFIWAKKLTHFFFLKLFDENNFELDNSDDKNYKIESFANEINLHK